MLGGSRVSVGSLTGGHRININNAAQTTLHTQPAASNGRARGAIVTVEIRCGTGASAIDVTMDYDSRTWIETVPAKGGIKVQFWMDPGKVLKAQGASAGLLALGYVSHVSG